MGRFKRVERLSLRVDHLRRFMHGVEGDAAGRRRGWQE